jgi:predicted RNase H-like HicB family nuclease
MRCGEVPKCRDRSSGLRPPQGARQNRNRMALDAYKVVLYRNQPEGWVAEIPAIEGGYAPMPTRAEAVEELSRVFDMIAAEYHEKGLTLPAYTTEIVHA